MSRFASGKVRADRRRPVLGNFAAVRALYDGWLTVNSSTGIMDRYVTENLICFQGGWVETRQFSWSNPLESVCSTTKRCYLLNMSLAGWATGASARNLRAMTGPDALPMGRVFMVPPDQTMQFSSLEGRSRSIRCVLDTELFDSFLADVPDWREDEGSIHAAFHIGGGQVEWLLRRMYREMHEPDFATPRMVESLAQQLTGEIVRALRPGRADVSHRAGGLAPWRLRLIHQRVAAEVPLPSVDELASLCDMNVRHLGRAFRGETGQTIGKYIESGMVDRAKRMLGAGASVDAVAASLGYSTARSFAAAFRRATGLLPREVSAASKIELGPGRGKSPNF